MHQKDKEGRGGSPWEGASQWEKLPWPGNFLTQGLSEDELFMQMELQPWGRSEPGGSGKRDSGQSGVTPGEERSEVGRSQTTWGSQSGGSGAELWKPHCCPEHLMYGRPCWSWGTTQRIHSDLAGRWRWFSVGWRPWRWAERMGFWTHLESRSGTTCWWIGCEI